MPDSDYMPRKRSMFPFIVTIWIIHFVFAFATTFVMYFFTLFLAPSVAQTVGTIFSILLFFSMLYAESWRAGQQDHNLMKFGHMQDDKYRGLKASLLSQIPGLALAVFAIIYRLAPSFPVFFYTVFKLFYMPFADVIWLFDQVTPLLYLVICLIPPALVHLGYLLGYNGYMVSEKLIYKQKKTSSDRERKFR